MKNNKKVKYVLIGIVLVLFTAICFMIYYVHDYYRASNSVNKYLKDSDTVKVIKEDDIYFFDGYGEDDAIIFYQGGKVENISYAPLLNKLSQNGIDCFLVNMPFNLAFLDINAANKVKNKYEYKNWYIMGHSLGGVAASMYAKDNNVTGLILLASYPSNKIDDNIKILSIYGSNDGVLNKKAYNDNKKNFSINTREYIIDGANHANFGNYGKQAKDNESFIDREEQQDITVNYIKEFVLGD